MKFFDLIFGDQVHVKAGKKVIPASEFSQLQDAAEVLTRLREETLRYKRDVAAEAEKEKDIAQQEGFRAGMEVWAEHIANLQVEVERIRKETHEVILPVALEAAKKIVGREIELSRDTIVDIIARSLKQVSSHRTVTIYVNRSEFELIEDNKERLKEPFERLESLSIQQREDIEPGGCVIETEVGIINAQLSHQWEILKEAFKSLLDQHPTEEGGE